MAVITLGSPLRDRVDSARLRLQTANVLCCRLALALETGRQVEAADLLDRLQGQLARAGQLLQRP